MKYIHKKIKQLIPFAFLLLTPASDSFAQEIFAVQIKQTKVYNPLMFENLMGLGTLKNIKSNNIHKVQLDGYLTKATAVKIRQKVRNKGYKDAFIVRSGNLSSSKNLYAVQLGVFSNLDLRKLVSANKIFSKRKLYVERKGNAYAVYLGMYQSQKRAEEAKSILARRGIKSIVKLIKGQAVVAKKATIAKKTNTKAPEKQAVKSIKSNKKRPKPRLVKNKISPKKKSPTRSKATKQNPSKTKKPEKLALQSSLGSLFPTLPSIKVLSPAEQEDIQRRSRAERIAFEEKERLRLIEKVRLDSLRKVKEVELAIIRKKEEARRDSLRRIKEAKLAVIRKKEKARRDSLKRIADEKQRIIDAKKRKEAERIAKIKRAKSRRQKSKPESVVKAIPVTKPRPPKNKKPYLSEMNVGNYSFRLLGLEEDYNLSVSGIDIYYKKRKVQTINGLKANVPTSERDRCLIFEDMNFDGLRDLRLLEYLPVGLNIPYLCWTFDPKSTDFVYNYPISAIFAPKIDKENQQIISYQKKSPSTYCRTYYKFFGKNLLPIQQDFETYDDRYSYQLRILKRQEDGQMLEVESKRININ